MTLTLLIDLDDTLLSNNMDRFLPAYLKLLGKQLNPYIPAERMIPQLLSATRQMSEKIAPGSTLESIFDAGFYPALGADKADWAEPLATFYQDVFPSLQPLTQPRPEAVQLVKTAFRRGYQVVIATNPLFPLQAIHHRLTWAGLSPTEYPFALITAFEGFHHAKPHPAYFAEILAQLGWPNQPAVMIGNDLSQDILPAAAIGLPVFWLSDDEFPQPVPALSKHGQLSEIADWLEKIDEAQPEMKFEQPAAFLPVLQSTPGALCTLTRSLSAPQYQQAPAINEWSLTEIFCHLRDVEAEVNLLRVQKILQEENIFVPGIDSDRWAEERQYNRQDGAQALTDFTQSRTRLLELLTTMPPQNWQRPFRHAIFGPTDLREMMSFIATHDRTHLQQVYKTCQAVNV